MPDEILTLDDLKQEVFVQCGEDAGLPRTLEFRMGYFHRSQKLWINNEQDLRDAWNIVYNNEKLTLWALPIAVEKNKKRSRRSSSDDDDNSELLTG